MIQFVSRVALSFGLFLLLASGLLLFALTPGSSAFDVSIINLIMGGTMVGIGVFAGRMVARRANNQEEQ